MTPLEKFNKGLELEKASHQRNLKMLEDILKYERETCDHYFVFVTDLFYALGETADGYECSWCGATRNEMPKKSFLDKMRGK